MKKAKLTIQMRRMLIEWSIEAHKIDKRKSVGDYFNLFMKRLRYLYKNTDDKERFYRDGILERNVTVQSYFKVVDKI